MKILLSLTKEPFSEDGSNYHFYQHHSALVLGQYH